MNSNRPNDGGGDGLGGDPWDQGGPNSGAGGSEPYGQDPYQQPYGQQGQPDPYQQPYGQQGQQGYDQTQAWGQSPYGQDASGQVPYGQDQYQQQGAYGAYGAAGGPGGPGGPGQNEGKSKTGLIVGLVGGLVALIAIIGGLIFFLGGDDEEPTAREGRTTSERETTATSDDTGTATSTTRETTTNSPTTTTTTNDGDFSAAPGYYGTGLDIDKGCTAPEGIRWVGSGMSWTTCATAEDVASQLVGYDVDDAPISVTAYDDVLDKDVDFTCEETTDGDGDSLFECTTDLDTVYVYP